ncbi:MAG: hypothetical protein JRH20_04920 [Deltaproteobacteria bacterium]|nr:hypothetical protein [Deltaproteobacteria bacterium]
MGVRTALGKRGCNACGSTLQAEGATVCARCGAALPPTTPTAISKPPPELRRKWLEATTEPPLLDPRSAPAQTLIGMVPPIDDDDGNEKESLWEASHADFSEEAPPAWGDAPVVLGSQECELDDLVQPQAGGLPTMPLERLPSYSEPPGTATEELKPEFADTLRHSASSQNRSTAKTLPPSSLAPAPPAPLAEVSSLTEAVDPAPSPVGEEAPGRGFGVLDEVSSPEGVATAPKPVSRPTPPHYEANADTSSRHQVFADPTANVMPRSAVPRGHGQGVNLGLLALWVVAIAATVAAIVVLVFR